MSLEFILKNSPISNEPPYAGQLETGEIALNYHADGCFLTCVDTAGTVRRLNEVWVNATPPSSPELGLLWCDISDANPLLKIWLGASPKPQWFVVGSGGAPGPGGGVQSISTIPNGGVLLSGTAENPILSVDNTVVRTSGDQFIGGNKTFLNAVRGNLKGKADTAGVADAVNQRISPGAGLTGGGVLTSPVTLALLPATTDALGGVRVGTGIAVNQQGTISVDVTPGNIYLGAINVVSKDVPPEPDPKPNGSYYINTATGVALQSWIGIAGQQVFDGNYIIFNGPRGVWENAGTVIGGGVEKINAGDGILVANPESSEPTVSVAPTVVRTSRKVLGGDGLEGGGSLDQNVVLSLKKATTDVLGGIRVGSGLTVTDGTLSVDITGALIYKGATQVDFEEAPPNPQVGWTYVNDKFAKALPSWVGIAGKEINGGTLLIWNGTIWQIGGEVASIGISAIVAGPGITVLDGSTSTPTVQVNEQVVRITGAATIGGIKTFVEPIVGDITGTSSFASKSDRAGVADSCTRQVLVGDGLLGGGILTNDIVVQCDDTVVRTVNNQEIDGNKRFLKAIQGNLNGNADTATNAQFAQEAVLADTLDRSVIASNGIQGGGKLTADVNIEVDSTVIRDFGNQTIGGDKKFLKAIQGNLNGNADTATNAQFAQEAVLAKTLDLSVIAGDGLTGGGLLTSNITVAVDPSVVRTSTDQTIDGNKRFLKAIQGNLNGNADTATNAQFAQEAVLAETLELSVLATDGLKGGGQLTTNVSIGLPNTGVSPGSYNVSNVSVDQYGRVTGASATSVTASQGIQVNQSPGLIALTFSISSLPPLP
jgi:hypothetical protein